MNSQKLYDSSAEFGSFMVSFSLFTSIITSLIAVAISIHLLVYDGKYNKEINATVLKDSECSVIIDKNNTPKQFCNTVVRYVHDKTKYENYISTEAKFPKGKALKILIDPDDPGNAVLKTGMRKTFGYIILAFAVFISTSAAMKYYIANRFKFAAAASGIGEGIALASTPFRK